MHWQNCRDLHESAGNYILSRKFVFGSQHIKFFQRKYLPDNIKYSLSNHAKLQENGSALIEVLLGILITAALLGGLLNTQLREVSIRNKTRQRIHAAETEYFRSILPDKSNCTPLPDTESILICSFYVEENEIKKVFIN